MVATVRELAELVRGKVVGDGSVSILAAHSITEAGPGDITFIENERYAKLLRTSPASAAIVGPHFKRASEIADVPVIEVEDPMTAFVAVRKHLSAELKSRWVGVHKRAFVSPTAKIGRDVAIYPFAYVGEDAEIGDGSTLHPGVVVGDRCKLGKEVVIRPNAVLYEGVIVGDRAEIHAGTVVGSDGFGYRLVDGKHIKVPQMGMVEIGADVEIGSNCTIDRATFEATRIGEGTKIDNLVMIGHNNQIGRHNLLCAQVGFAGSSKTGDYVVMGGQAGVKDKVEIGDRVVVGAKTGIHRSFPSDCQLLGWPAGPARETRRLFQLITRLPEMHRQLRAIAAQVAALAGAKTAMNPGEAETRNEAEIDP